MSHYEQDSARQDDFNRMRYGDGNKHSPPPFNRCDDENCRGCGSGRHYPPRFKPQCRPDNCGDRNYGHGSCDRNGDRDYDRNCDRDCDRNYDEGCYQPCLPPIDDFFLLDHLLKKYNIDKLKLICHLEKVEIVKEKNRIFATFYCRFPSQKALPLTDQWIFFKEWICKFCPQFEIDKCDMENYLQGKLHCN
jgi:hypothetical protein